MSLWTLTLVTVMINTSVLAEASCLTERGRESTPYSTDTPSRRFYKTSCDGTESTPTATLLDTAGRVTVSWTKESSEEKMHGCPWGNNNGRALGV